MKKFIKKLNTPGILFIIFIPTILTFIFEPIFRDIISSSLLLYYSIIITIILSFIILIKNFIYFYKEYFIYNGLVKKIIFTLFTIISLLLNISLIFIIKSIFYRYAGIINLFILGLLGISIIILFIISSSFKKK